jgi:hypothetical protein
MPFRCPFNGGQCNMSYDTISDLQKHALTHGPRTWHCIPFGLTTTVKGKCIFCGEDSPSTEHFNKYQVRRCQDKQIGTKGRSVFRKDHLLQHIRSQYHMTQGNLISDVVNDWQQYCAGQPQLLPCGFCEESHPWLELVRHLRRHRQELATGT